ncbi:MAG: hypothetical protein SGPRY_009490, partial [Prymnesium sp.]
MHSLHSASPIPHSPTYSLLAIVSGLRSLSARLAFTGPVPLEGADGRIVPGGGMVHDGFQSAAKRLWAQIEPCLPPSTRLTLTGHSLGGGVATLLTLYALAQGREASLVTVAGPRLGDRSFARHFRESCPTPAGERNTTHTHEAADEIST